MTDGCTCGRGISVNGKCPVCSIPPLSPLGYRRDPEEEVVEMSGATNGITWTKDGRGLSAGSVSSITVGSVEDFKCLHDRVVDLDKHTGDLVEGLKNLLGRLTGRQEEESSGQVPEIPRVSTETALSGAANNVGQALCLLEQLRRRLYGE